MWPLSCLVWCLPVDVGCECCGLCVVFGFVVALCLLFLVAEFSAELLVAFSADDSGVCECVCAAF